MIAKKRADMSSKTQAELSSVKGYTRSM